MLTLVVSLAGATACGSGRIAPPATGDQTVPHLGAQRAAPSPRRYLAPRRTASIVIDGRLDDAAWAGVPWTKAFTDIEGPVRPPPSLMTRVRMTWDDQYWYLAARLQEPDLWATIRKRDAVIFRDNDFELFVDPSGTTQRYFEVEVNQLGTVWDLMLPKAYRDSGSADNSWDIHGLKLAVTLDGTLNRPGDLDRGWTVEMAIPWAAFSDSGRNPVPPHDGAQWRVNFSRVEWDVNVAGAGYVKRNDAAGHPLPEHNWVWSPQGAVNMHLPEMWGVVQFGGTSLHVDAAADRARWQLRRVYYAERAYREKHASYAGDLAALGLASLKGVRLSGGGASWQATTSGGSGREFRIRTDGRIE